MQILFVRLRGIEVRIDLLATVAKSGLEEQ
jgi:hypothetical protein